MATWILCILDNEWSLDIVGRSPSPRTTCGRCKPCILVLLEPGAISLLLKTNSKKIWKFSNWYHLARGLTRLKIFRKFSIRYHPWAQKHTSQASGCGMILVWVVPIWKFSENSQIGTGSVNSKPGQNLPPPRFGSKSENHILIVHNSDFGTMIFDDTRIFDTVLTWSTL